MAGPKKLNRTKCMITFMLLFMFSISYGGGSGIKLTGELNNESASDSDLKLGTLDPQTFYFHPDTDHELQWKIISGSLLPGDLDYEITDFYGVKVDEGTAITNDSILVSATVNLPRGYYQIHFPKPGVKFGMAVLAYLDPTEEPDRYFGIHAELCHDDRLTYLSDEDQLIRHENLFKTLHRIGIRRVRDRLVIGKFAPRPDKWSWEGDNFRYDQARPLFHKYDIDFMPNNAVAPNWMRRADDVIPGSNLDENKYPSDLIAYTDTYLKIYERWQNEIETIEIWNEPSGMTYDRLGPLINAMTYAFKTAGHDVEMVSGVFAGIKRNYAESIKEMKCWEALDMISFHTYSIPEQAEGRTAFYKNTAGGEENPYLPVGISEMGQKYIGGHWPTLEQEYLRSWMITGNAVEAKASGNEFFIPFKYLAARFSDGNNQTQHTLNDIWGTPFLSLASYANAIVKLSHKEYLGDLQISDPNLISSRVFGNGTTAVAVLYTSNESVISIDAPILDVTGMDGRELSLNVDGDVITEDRLVYVTFNQADIQGLINENTPAMDLYERSKQKDFAPPPRVRPVVLQHFADYDHLEYTPSAYQLKTIFQGNVPLSFQATNLSNEEKTVELTLELPPFLTSINDLTKTVTVPAKGTAMMGWYIQIDEEEPGFTGDIVLRSADLSDTLVAPVKFEVICPRDVPDVLNSFESYRRIDISNQGKWFLWGQPGTDLDLNIDNNIANFSLSATENKVGTKAFYNINNYDLTKAKGLLVVAREDKQPSYYSRYWPKIKFGVQEQNGSQYLGTEMPADGDKHWSYIEFEKLPVNLGDDNQTLDLDSIWRFVVSTWHAIPEVTVNFEVYDVYIVSDSALFENSEFNVKLEVKNEDTGEKLSDARILFGDQLFHTDSTGSVNIENVEYGFYENEVSIEGYYPIEDQYLEVYSDTTITLFLQKDFPDLRLRFTDKSSGEPVYRVAVSYDNMTKLSDDEGYLLINDLKTDSLIFSAEHSDYFHFSDTISLIGDSTVNLKLFPLRADISFIISDSAGEIKNAEVDIQSTSGFTNGRGELTFYEQPAGRMYNYVITAEGYNEYRDSFFLEVDTIINYRFESTQSSGNISPAGSLRLYPNPVTNNLIIKLDNYTHHSSLVLMNVYGKLLLRKAFDNGFLSLDVSKLNKGTYFIGVQVKDQMVYRKIIK